MRYETRQPGIHTWHSFSAGAHYDPDNVAFGPVVGLDEHTVDPGAGFDWHGHRGVHIVSWVLDGTLRHEDSNGVERFVAPGVLLVQSTGDGIRHRETNASDTESLRFVQMTVLGDDAPGVRLTKPPLSVGGVEVVVESGGYGGSSPPPQLITVLDGEFDDGDAIAHYGPGDTIRLETEHQYAFLDGTGTLLVVSVQE